MQRISVCDNRFIDSEGRHIILSGINLVFKGEQKEGGMNYYGPWSEKDFAQFHDWGFNVIRLGIIWDALEPEPGIYNETYLDWIGSLLDWCEKYKIYAFLDMHQDLYSVLYSDGAPAWATLTDDKPHVGTELWSDAYLFSEAVQRAFDHFWANDPAPDGVGLQDHFADTWRHVAKRFSKHPALLGYDFLNEPFPGSAGPEIFFALMAALADKLSALDGQPIQIEDMIAAFSNPEDKLKILGLLEDKTFYQDLAKSVEPLVAHFDQQVLDPFYQKLTARVRTVDPQSIIFRENSYFSNIGIECLGGPILDPSGEKDPLQAFSPHGYDLVVDTEAIVLASHNRVDVIFDAHRRTQERLGVPVLVGEWGAHGHYAEGLEHIEHLLHLFDQYLWSHTYWCYDSHFDQAPVLKVLKRPYPRAVCGLLLKYEFNRKDNLFSMTWNEEGCFSSTEIYLPEKSFNLSVDGPYEVTPLKTGAVLRLLPKGGQRNLLISL